MQFLVSNIKMEKNKLCNTLVHTTSPIMYWSPNVDAGQRLLFRRVFAKGPQQLYFRDARVARNFGRCLESLEKNGALDKVAKPYVDMYSDIVLNQHPVR